MGVTSPLKQPKHATLRIYKKAYTRTGFGLKINDQLVVKRLKNRSWIDIEVPAGTLTLETVPEFRYPANDGKAFYMKVEKGKLYYLEAVIDYEFWVSTLYLVLRDKERAEAEYNDSNRKNMSLKKWNNWPPWGFAILALSLTTFWGIAAS